MNEGHGDEGAWWERNPNIGISALLEFGKLTFYLQLPTSTKSCLGPFAL
jgi:hypothetical protein